jgi:hypothetical protein
MFYFIFLDRKDMGRKDKHNVGKTRNNPVFKVVGAKVAKQSKGRPKGVDVKLKKVTRRICRLLPVSSV